MNFRLRQLGFLWRLGLSALILVFFIGFFASAAHMWFKYENRDERPGLTLDDVKAQYSGLETVSPLLTSLRGGHPETLKGPDRETLIKWLTGDKVAENYDSIDIGSAAPSEIIASSCLQCHSRKATTADPNAKAIVLDYADDIKKLSVTRKINAAPIKIKANSTHAHAPAMATMSVVIGLLVLCTRWWRWIGGLLMAAVGIGLLADIGSWWLSEYSDRWAIAIVVGGMVYNVATTLQLLLVLADLWLPGGRGEQSPKS